MLCLCISILFNSPFFYIGIATSALVPFADMLNHHRPQETRWGYETSNNTFFIKSVSKITSGLPVYDSYGKKKVFIFYLDKKYIFLF